MAELKPLDQRAELKGERSEWALWAALLTASAAAEAESLRLRPEAEPRASRRAGTLPPRLLGRARRGRARRGRARRASTRGADSPRSSTSRSSSKEARDIDASRAQEPKNLGRRLALTAEKIEHRV